MIKKLQHTFLGPGFTQCSLKYKGEYKTNNFLMYIAPHEKIFQQMENLKNDSYAGIDASTCVSYFLGGINETSIKTAVQICESQDSYSVNFLACTSYLTTMVHKTSYAKQLHVAAAASKVKGVKLKNRDGMDQCLPPAKYQEVSTRCSILSKRNGSGNCKIAKAHGEDIPVAKKKQGQPPTKQAWYLDSAMISHFFQISSLTFQNQKMMHCLLALSFDIPNSYPSLGKGGRRPQDDS